MGIQNAAACIIAVPDLTTSVLTLTVTGLTADSALVGGAGSKVGRRVVPIATVLAGALLGAALIWHAQAYDPLVIALATIITGAAVTRQRRRLDSAWVGTQHQRSPVPSQATSTGGADERGEPRVGRQTRYELRGEAGLSAVLIYTADPDEPALWKILLPGPGGTEDLYGAQRFPNPEATRLQAWLTPMSAVTTPPSSPAPSMPRHRYRPHEGRNGIG